MLEEREVRIRVGEGEVSGRLRLSDRLLVLGHGAGAGMDHPFLRTLADELAAVGVGTLRYQFPYMEARRGYPDRPPLLIETVAATVRMAIELAPESSILAGGKSMGGRMTSLAAAEGRMPEQVRGLVFFGFPLHAAGKPSLERGRHLSSVGLPMLFLQGSRDRLADLVLLKDLLEDVQPPPLLKVFDQADHSFRVPKRSGMTNDEVMIRLAAEVDGWSRDL